MKYLLNSLLAVWLLAASSAWAQPYYGGYGGSGWGYGAGNTVAGSYMAGMSGVIQSEGYYNLLTSQANINNQTAENQYIDNRMKATNAYFEMRRNNHDYRAAERGPSVTQAELDRFAREAAPKRLTFSQLDPITGRINWHEVLLGPQFAGDRQKIEAGFSKLAEHEVSYDLPTINEIRTAANDMRERLRAEVSTTPPELYVRAKRFIDSLVYEATSPPSG